MKTRVLPLILALAAMSCSDRGARAAPGGLSPSSLPALQTNVGGDASIEWRYANAVLGCEVWILDSSSGAEARDRFQANPGLLDARLTEGGWPAELPDGVTVTLSPLYRRKADPAPGQLRSDEYENLTGMYVVTWKGRTLPDRDGRSRFEILDTVNDGNPRIGAKVIAAGDRRAIVLVRDKGRGVNIRYQKPDPADPIRDVKVWTPLYQGAGLGVDVSRYDEARLGPGKLKSWCAEPGPGEADPLWHPMYLKHLRDDPGEVLRFMGFLDINGLEGEAARARSGWASRKPATYTLGSLVAVSPANWIRRGIAGFRGGGQVPYEWLFDLCAKVGKDPWIQAPHTASAEYVSSLASLSASLLPKGRRLWFEFSNELWNNYGPYVPQYEAAEAEGRRSGKDQGWGSGRLQALALRRFEEAWLKAGRGDDELVNVLSGFALSPDYNARVLSGAKSVASGIPETMAISTYFGAGLTAELFALPYGRGSPSDEVYRSAARIIRRDIHQTYESWKANADVCRAEGLPLIAYEGGSHLMATGYGDRSNPSHAAFMSFLANLHKHPVMSELYLEHWAFWIAAGGHTASMWTDIGAYGYYGYWGAKEDVTESAGSAPRVGAALEYAKLRKGIRAIGDPVGSSPRLEKVAKLRLEAGVPGSILVRASGGEGPLSSFVLGGEVPPGLAPSGKGSEGLRMEGTPSASGRYLFVVGVADRDGDPDYAVLDLTVDPKGSSGGGLILFDAADLPSASLAKSEGREEYRSRFDVSASRSFVDDSTELGPRRYLPFDPSTPLFSTHYIDRSVALEGASPFAVSGGLSITLLKDSFLKANPSIAGLSSAKGINPSNTETLLWFGYRDRLLAGWLGSSLELKPGAGGGEGGRYGIPTIFDALLMWRLDQMGKPGGAAAAFGPGEDQAALVLETAGTDADGAEWRFVIRARTPGGARYYISEAAFSGTAKERYSLLDFNGNPSPGKRWAPFAPGPSDFSIPPESRLKYGPVDFAQVDGVGVALRARRFGWHYGIGIARFVAIGKR